MYEIDKSIKSFAVANDFVVQTNKACYQLGVQLLPFCIFANAKQKEYNVLDIANFSGMLDSNVSLVKEIADFRKQQYVTSGFYLPDSIDKTLFYDYLLSISICYVEVPRYVTKNGVAQESFDKFLCTKNPRIMSAWMGCEPREMQAKYSARVEGRLVELQMGDLRVVKLMHSGKGNSIVCPRSCFNTENMKCIPMYMLYAFIEGFKTKLNTGILKFSYLKDNGTVRELVSTLNEGILMKYYNDNNFVGTMLSGVDINTVQQGGLSLASKMNRGYIKIPELGSSIYDESGVRSLNLARILAIEETDKVDTSFIKVDLMSAVQNFKDGVDYMVGKIPDSVKQCYTTLTGDICGENVVAVGESLKSFADSRSALLSTTFHRQLHMFMVSHPEWFPLYTGQPNRGIVKSNNSGIMPMDF